MHSIGVLLFRAKQQGVFDKFIVDMIYGAGVEIVTMPLAEITRISDNAERFGLDFDDAYHYSVAERYKLTIVSFDSDFDRTGLNRKTPSELL